MIALDDETLVGMADGALTLEEHSSAERQLATDPGARRAVLLLRLSAHAVRDAFAGPEFEHVPEHLRQIPRVQPRLGSTLARCTRRLTGRAWTRLAATAVTACGLAIIAGLSFQGYLVQEKGRTAHVSLGPIAPLSDLAHALDRVAGIGFRPAAAVADRFVITATKSDATGNTCHQVEAYASADLSGTPDLIVACQGGNGWSVVGLVAAASLANPAHANQSTAAAEALQGLLAMIGAQNGSALSGKEGETQ